jgi:hypothetical protein
MTLKQDNMPERSDLCQHQPGQPERLEHGEGLRHHEQPMPVPAIDQRACQWGEQQGGDLPGTTHHP